MDQYFVLRFVILRCIKKQNRLTIMRLEMKFMIHLSLDLVNHPHRSKKEACQRAIKYSPLLKEIGVVSGFLERSRSHNRKLPDFMLG